MKNNENPFEDFKLPKGFETLIEYQEQMAEAVKPIIEFQEVIADYIKPYFEIAKSMSELIEPLTKIDWKALSEAAQENIIYTEQQLKEYEQLLWCLDIETFSVLEEKDAEYISEYISEYIKENLFADIGELMKDPMFKMHWSLIEETYVVYELGYYKLCVFPLFSIFEHIINSWFDGNIQDEAIFITKRPQGKRYYSKINKLVEEDENNEVYAYIKLFAYSVLRIYLKTFESFGDEPKKELNRHSIAHGFHDYDSVEETDVLKLFQLLKATTILQYISIDDLSL